MRHDTLTSLILGAVSFSPVSVCCSTAHTGAASKFWLFLWLTSAVKARIAGKYQLQPCPENALRNEFDYFAQKILPRRFVT